MYVCAGPSFQPTESPFSKMNTSTSSSSSSKQPHKKSRQSISTSTLHPNNTDSSSSLGLKSGGPRLSVNPAPISKPTLKKRSKSLGGLALEQKILRDNNRDQEALNVDLDLTPRKKARRSLVPGKSILKLRPTISGPGLERTTSDNTLTLNSHTQPLSSFLNATGFELSSSQVTHQSINNPSTILSQPSQASQDTENQNPSEHNEINQADNSSDMDLSDDQGLHRASLGSSTTTLLRRVSFAAKAHVRTFGSPLVEPDSSMASSTAPAPSNDPPGHRASSAGETNASEDDTTADMSMDSTVTNHQPDAMQHSSIAQKISNPSKRHPSPLRDALKPGKSSRLSMAIPGFGSYDDDDDDDDAHEEQGRGAYGKEDLIRDPSSPQPAAHQSKHPDNVKASKASRLTTFLASSQENEVAGGDETPENLNPHHQRQPTEQGTNPELDQSHAPPPAHKLKKPSRLTQLFSDWDDLSRELDNARDKEEIGPSLYSEESEPAPKKARSRISEFLQPQDSSDMEEADPALIDLHEPASDRASFGPPPNRSSSSAPLQNLQEHEDLINMSFEDNPAPNPAPVLPGSPNSGQFLLPTSYESTSRAGSFPRVSLEPALPRLSSIRGLPQLSSASPSRRLSGSLLGSPKKLRLSFASPRRSTLTAETSKQSNQSDSAHSTSELLRSNSANQSASVQEIHSDLRRSSNPSNLSVGTQGNHSHNSSMPPPETLPVPPSPLLISLNEFFEQAEIRFISLSQPRVRNHDQQEHLLLSEGQHRVSSFAQQIFAGMVKIPRLRLLESSSRSLRQKTELLDFTTKEHESEISRNAQRYKLLKDWVDLRQKQTQTGQTHSQTSQKHLEDLDQMMNQLRLKKNWVEMSAKQDCHLFDIEMWKTYQANLHHRTAKLSHDLEMMRKIDSIVKPSTESLRERKQNLTEDIRRRKQKLSEIESCDQNMLKALKEEAKDLAAVTEANRRALTESEFERNLWLTKFAELEQEKKEHAQRIEQLKRDPDQSQQCTVQELVRLKNEFVGIQKMLGWELIRFEDDLFVFTFYLRIGVIFHLDPFDPKQLRNVRKVELRWTEPSGLVVEQDDPLRRKIEQFFFGHLKAHFDGKKVRGRVRELVQEISSTWYQARQLVWEITNAQVRFSVAVDILEPSTGKNRARVSSDQNRESQTMDVRVTIRSPRNCAAAHCHFFFDGQEILDWIAPAPLAHVSCKVTPVLGKADCLNLSYVLSEQIDKGHRGALKDACLEALTCLDA